MPRDAGGQGDWIVKKDAIGEHWVCDGQNVYEYRHDQKQLVVRPIPPAMQGKAIVDGPLPFLFGAEAAQAQGPLFDAGRAAAESERDLDPRRGRGLPPTRPTIGRST